MSSSETVVVLGASPKPERYSFKAIKMLEEFGHSVLPVNPNYQDIAGRKVYSSLEEINQQVDTVTIYLSAPHSDAYLQQLLSRKPRRVIFNPGSENSELRAKLANASIEVVEACTLVMLKTKAF